LCRKKWIRWHNVNDIIIFWIVLSSTFRWGAFSSLTLICKVWNIAMMMMRWERGMAWWQGLLSLSLSLSVSRLSEIILSLGVSTWYIDLLV
jgi:hypothetical protein